MEPTLLIYIFLSYAVAGLIKGISGLGFSTVCIGVMASFLDLTTAIPLAVIPSIASCLIVMVEAGHFREAIVRFRVLYLFTLPGLGLGLWLLVTSDGTLAKAVLGIILGLYGIWGLLNPRFDLSAGMIRRLRAPTGILTGIFHGLTGVAVIPLVPYLLAVRLPSDLFVQSVNISFLFSSLIVLATLGGLGYFDLPLLIASLAGIVPVMLAAKAGVRIRRRLTGNQFRTVILIVLIGLGINLLVGR